MKQLNLLSFLSAAILVSCGADPVEFANQTAESYDSELKALSVESGIGDVMTSLEDIDQRYTYSVDSFISEEDLESEEVSNVNTIISDRITSSKNKIVSDLRKKGEEGFAAVRNKYWKVVTSSDDENYWKGIFKINEQMTFLNLKGKYKLSLQEGPIPYTIDGGDVTFEQKGNSIYMYRGMSKYELEKPSSADMMIGSFSGNIFAYGTNVYTTSKWKNSKKGTLSFSGKSYPMTISYDENEKVTMNDGYGGQIYANWDDNVLSGRMKGDGVDFPIKLNKKKTETSIGMYSFSSYQTKESREAEERASRSSSSSNSSNATGDSDMDEMLDNYEEYVDNYVVLLKKANEGDASAMMEYATMLQKANKLQSSLAKSTGNLSASQLQRMLKIQGKLAQAAINL